QGTVTGTGFDPTPASVLVNLNQVGGPGGVVNASSTFASPPFSSPTSVPEPSAILGILAVAGAGAFARRKS
ncbi:MAG: PEP-CTERM sorting domain-containing protein, partial [Microcystis aeruginosa]